MKLWKMKKSSDFDHEKNEFGWKKCRHSSNPGQNPEIYDFFQIACELIQSCVIHSHRL
jgi:hypothetical protein